MYAKTSLGKADSLGKLDRKLYIQTIKSTKLKN
jgi:hypothetical protein